MSHNSSLTPILLLLVLMSTGLSEEPATEAGSDASRQESAARLTKMRRRVFSLTIEAATADGKAVPVKIIETPLLRYGNPAARIVIPDATVWVWGQTGRPVAMASLDDKDLEIVSFSDRPLTLTAKSGLSWSPAKSQIEWQLVPEALVPGQTPAIRARQMKEISRRFTATGHYPDSGDIELRLLDRHLHRYSDTAAGIVDGAIFSLVGGTNPEVIVLIECRENSTRSLQWYYGVTRLSGGRLEAKLDDRLIWECPAIERWNPIEPYWSSPFGAADFVTENDLPPIKASKSD